MPLSEKTPSVGSPVPGHTSAGRGSSRDVSPTLACRRPAASASDPDAPGPARLLFSLTFLCLSGLIGLLLAFMPGWSWNGSPSAPPEAGLLIRVAEGFSGLTQLAALPDGEVAGVERQTGALCIVEPSGAVRRTSRTVLAEALATTPAGELVVVWSDGALTSGDRTLAQLRDVPDSGEEHREESRPPSTRSAAPEPGDGGPGDGGPGDGGPGSCASVRGLVALDDDTIVFIRGGPAEAPVEERSRSAGESDIVLVVVRPGARGNRAGGATDSASADSPATGSCREVVIPGGDAARGEPRALARSADGHGLLLARLSPPGICMFRVHGEGELDDARTLVDLPAIALAADGEGGCYACVGHEVLRLAPGGDVVGRWRPPTPPTGVCRSRRAGDVWVSTADALYRLRN